MNIVGRSAWQRERPPRGLRGRYIDEVNERGLLPEAWGDEKYNVSRLIEGDIRVRPEEVRLLGAG